MRRHDWHDIMAGPHESERHRKFISICAQSEKGNMTTQ